MAFANNNSTEMISDMTLREKARLAERAARDAGELLEHHGALHIRRKSENDFVTEMDVKSENLIREILLTACPEDDFFGEEGGGATEADGRWIVDPIDGTANYMRGQRIYTVSIAYELHGELVVGVVYSPGTDEMFVGVKGEGATCNGHPIHVSDVDVIRNAIVGFGYGHRDPAIFEDTAPVLVPLLHAVSDMRRYGTAAYELCSVAAGRTDAFIEQGIFIYDFAAGCVILREAGGRVDPWHPWQDPVADGALIAGNGRVNDAVAAILTPKA